MPGMKKKTQQCYIPALSYGIVHESDLQGLWVPHAWRNVMSFGNASPETGGIVIEISKNDLLYLRWSPHLYPHLISCSVHTRTLVFSEFVTVIAHVHF